MCAERYAHAARAPAHAESLKVCWHAGAPPPPRRYRTPLCKAGPECGRPVCFFAHSMEELRTPTLPASLAHSAEGAAFAAFYGAPSHSGIRSALRVRAPSLPPRSACVEATA